MDRKGCRDAASGRLKKWFSVKEPGSSAVEEENRNAWTAVESLLAEEKKESSEGLKRKRGECEIDQRVHCSDTLG
jgi:hypothetical protein